MITDFIHPLKKITFKEKLLFWQKLLLIFMWCFIFLLNVQILLELYFLIYFIIIWALSAEILYN